MIPIVALVLAVFTLIYMVAQRDARLTKSIAADKEAYINETIENETNN